MCESFLSSFFFKTKFYQLYRFTTPEFLLLLKIKSLRLPFLIKAHDF